MRVVHALTRRGCGDAARGEEGLALGASGTNSGILHTGFDSLAGRARDRADPARRRAARRAAARSSASPSALRRAAAPARGRGARDGRARWPRTPRVNGVEVEPAAPSGSLLVPGESITDPVAFVQALAAAAPRRGAMCGSARLLAALARPRGGGSPSSSRAAGELRARAVVNCAGPARRRVARLAGDAPFEVYPRKGEFLVFAPPAGGALDRDPAAGALRARARACSCSRPSTAT